MTGADGEPQTRSKMGYAHSAVLMNEGNTLKEHLETPKSITHQVDQHTWIEQWTTDHPADIDNQNQTDQQKMTRRASSKPNCSDTNQCALIDGEANSITAGEDCKFVGKSSMDQTVNVTGMDDHQMADIRVGTVGSLAESDQGNAILVMNENAHIGRHTTILSSPQMVHCGNLIDDKPIQLEGRQKIVALEGCGFPRSMINELTHLKMRTHTQTEFDTLSHVIFTSYKQWNPQTHNNKIKPTDPNFKLNDSENYQLLPCNDCDTKGEYTGQANERVFEPTTTPVHILDED